MSVNLRIVRVLLTITSLEFFGPILRDYSPSHASPMRGAVYVEEFSLGNAEDVTEILSTTCAFGSDPELDQSVPRQLAELLCAGDCVVTKNFSLLEPGVFARKYYARGIGVFLEVESEGQVSRLVSCNLDPRCGALPMP